jgi:hypothetical protein
MKQHVVRQALAALAEVKEEAVVNVPALAGTVSAAVVTAALILLLAMPFGDTFLLWCRRNLLLEEVEWPYRTLLAVENFPPGALSLGVPRGDPLTLRVRASGELPERVRIRIQYEKEQRALNLSREGESLFLYEHPEVAEPFHFVVEGGDFRSPRHEILVKERPRVESLELQLVYPAYTGKAPQTLAGDIGEVASPEGTIFNLRGLASKELRRAWLETEGLEIELPVSAGDRRRFEGAHTPAAGGLVTVHLEDLEDVPPDQHFRFIVVPVPDALPLVRASAQGIGSMITPRARLPFKVRASDDYSVTGLGLEYEVRGDDKESSQPEKERVPLAKVADPAPLVEDEPVWEVGPLSIEPEKRLEVRVSATDNDAQNGPKTGFAAAQDFLVVAPEKLLEEFQRREEELRRVFERALERERSVRDGVYRLADEAWKEDRPLSSEVVNEMIALAKTQRELSRQLSDIAAAVSLLLDEMRNNRIDEVLEVERLALKVIKPLEDLASGLLPQTANRLGRIREMEEASRRLAEGLALAGDVEEILIRMDSILSFMKRLEGFTEIVSRWRAMMKKHDESIEEAKKAYERAVESLFDDREREGGGSPGGGQPPRSP